MMYRQCIPIISQDRPAYFGRRYKQILIQTKLNRPVMGLNSVARPRLISRLNEALKKRVTLISTPAGYSYRNAHLISIYRKLNAHNRRGAVEEAKRLKLI